MAGAFAGVRLTAIQGSYIQHHDVGYSESVCHKDVFLNILLVIYASLGFLFEYVLILLLQSIFSNLLSHFGTYIANTCLKPKYPVQTLKPIK